MARKHIKTQFKTGRELLDESNKIANRDLSVHKEYMDKMQAFDAAADKLDQAIAEWMTAITARQSYDKKTVEDLEALQNDNMHLNDKREMTSIDARKEKIRASAETYMESRLERLRKLRKIISESY